MTQDKKKPLNIPKNVAHRMGRLAFAGMKALSKEVLQRAQDSEIDLIKKRVAQAQDIVDALSQLKGAAMKTGQILSLEFSDLLPPEVIQVLSQLQDESNFMPIDKVEKILKRHLGKDLRDQYKNFSEVPIAAASIGQVHRAELDGQDVAVKIQYPGVDKTIGADIATLKRIIRPILWVKGQRVNFDPIFAEIEHSLLQEVDYNKEAAYLTKYRELAMPLDGFCVPSVVTSHSSKRVLTLSFEEGMRLKDWLRSSPTLDDRERFGERMLNLIYHEFFVWGFVQTDPNYGNFLYRPETKEIVLLDFGACKRYNKKLRHDITRLLSYAVYKDNDNLKKLSLEMAILDSRESSETTSKYFELMNLVGMMFRAENQPFDFGNLDYIKSLRECVLEFAGLVKHTGPAKELIFLNRKLGGIFHLLKDLEVSCDLTPFWSKVEQQIQTKG